MQTQSNYPELALLIGGGWESAEGRATLPVLNPATAAVLGEVPVATAEDLDRCIAAAAKAFTAWRTTSAYERAAILHRAADLLRQRLADVATALTLEQGKPLAEARMEVAAAADVFDWFAEEGRRAYGRIVPSRAHGLQYSVVREPVGPVAAFSPWNFPAVIPARKIAAALATGCTVIIKPAEETPATCLALARALYDAGLPTGVLSVVTGEPAFISEHLLKAEAIRKISFTGSTAVGRHLARLAGDTLKRATLELGGHAPVLVFDDADLDLAVAQSLATKFRNAGQVCTSPTRFYVHARIHDQFVERMAAGARALRVGDGLVEGTQMGPVAHARRLQALSELVTDAREHGAELLCGGEALQREGYFWQPTVLARVPARARIMNEEPFGPVLITDVFEELDEAIEKANRLPYGLAAYAFTRSLSTANALASGIECGMLGINNFAINFPETPFGGVKHSGYGSEGGSEGIEGYLTTKLVSIS